VEHDVRCILRGRGRRGGARVIVGPSDDAKAEACLIEIRTAEIAAEKAAFGEKEKHLSASAAAEKCFLSVRLHPVGIAREAEPAEETGTRYGGGGSRTVRDGGH
jgi:hypothetical protein